MRAGTHVLLVHLGDPSKRPLLGSERSLELQRLRLADWGEERVGLAIADRVQVLRRGRRVATYQSAATSLEELVGAMTGALDEERL